MQKFFYRFFTFLSVLALVVSCANRGTPSGGEKDEMPPKITKSTPENFTTNFKGNEIRIYFDEYIKIKDIQKQLIISPPMTTEPDITPLGTASKYIKIVLKDTLQPNTTYAFNFGTSIVDNNEENPYPYYKYVFSTGNYIDSLSVKGNILDAESMTADTFVSVMLYEVDSTYNDSVVYKKKPKYITNTLDSVTTFNIENIKAGKYKLVALKDENRNFTYQQKEDKIGFYDKVITVPSDTVYSVKLFKEELDFKAVKPKQAAGQKIAFGFEGDYKNMQIELLGDRPEGLVERITKDVKSDTLYYWYNINLERDSTLFVVSNKEYRDTLNFKFRDFKKDSLTINAIQKGSLNFNQNFEIEGSVPFTFIREDLIKIIDKDSVTVPFTTQFDELHNKYTFQFEKKESQVYKIKMLPEALTSFFGEVNDTLNYNLQTKAYSDYANIRVVLNNATYPVIVQLTDEKGNLKYEQFADKPKVFDFRYINTGNYYLRVVFDTNGNQKWDTGNYLKKIQPERISYDSKLIEASANWDIIQDFTLE